MDEPGESIGARSRRGHQPNRIAQRTGGDSAYESQLNAFVSIPYSKITEGALEREKIPHTDARRSQIIVHGNESEKFAGLLNAEIRRPMTGGLLDAKEPDSLRMIREILTDDVRRASRRRSQKICFTVPAPPLGAEGSLTYHEATLRQILTDLNCGPTSINEGLAIVYSELESSNYTGIGDELRRRLVQCLPGLSLGADDQLQHPQGRRLHRRSAASR